jgi:hypothetical protein
LPILVISSIPSLLQVKRACGQARWADKEDEADVTTSGRRHGDIKASGQDEILGGTTTQGHISIGQLQYMIPLY